LAEGSKRRSSKSAPERLNECLSYIRPALVQPRFRTAVKPPGVDIQPVNLSHDRVFVSRVGGAMFFAGGGLAAISLLLPHQSGLDESGLAITAAAAWVMGGILFAFAGRFSVTGIQVANACGIALVTSCIYFSGEAKSAYVVLYLWTGLYAFYFLPPRRALFQGGLIALAYALVPFASHQLWWLLVVGTVFVTGALVLFLQDRLGGLVGEVAAAASERELLAEIVRSSDDAIMSGAPDGTITTWNPGAERLYGYPAEEACGANVRDLIIPSTHVGDEKEIISRVLAGDRVDNYETQRRHRDGHLIDVSVSASAIKNDRGAVVGVSVITRDITERKRQERELLANVEAYGWLRRVRTALNEDRFVLYSQPIMCTRTGETVDEELLLRMGSERAEGGVIAPGAFLPVAEEFGMVGEIDQWVIRNGIPLIADNRRVSINLSGQSIGDVSITKLIESVIRDLEVDPSKLTIEITETALVRDMQAARTFTDRLERLGCALALDDFGTGYGSFTYLKHLPVQCIKIDVDFIRELRHSPADQQVVRSIVGVARGFGIKTVAEGVEDERTLDLVSEYGIDRAQGYHIARPGPAERSVAVELSPDGVLAGR
jgi:PAS domain S-box-containing protein